MEKRILEVNNKTIEVIIKSKQVSMMDGGSENQVMFIDLIVFDESRLTGMGIVGGNRYSIIGDYDDAENNNNTNEVYCYDDINMAVGNINNLGDFKNELLEDLENIIESDGI